MASGDVFPKMLCAPTLLGTSTTTLFTVPSNRQWAVKQIIVCNTDGVERIFRLGYNGSVVTAGNCFVYQLPIAAYDTIVLDTAMVFEAAQTLQGYSDTASKVTVSVTGWEREI
jgi:hypothetical protein